MKTPRTTDKPQILTFRLRRQHLRAIEKAIDAGNMHDVAASVAALLGYKFSVSRVRRLLARVRVPDVQRDIVLRRFCRMAAEIMDAQEAAIEKLFAAPFPKRANAIKNKKNPSPKTGTNRNPGGAKDAR